MCDTRRNGKGEEAKPIRVYIIYNPSTVTADSEKDGGKQDEIDRLMDNASTVTKLGSLSPKLSISTTVLLAFDLSERGSVNWKNQLFSPLVEDVYRGG